MDTDVFTVLDAARGICDSIHSFSAPTLSSHNSYIELLRTLADVLANASSAVAVLLNAAAPINNLPPELLSHVFMLCATEEKLQGDYVVSSFKFLSPRVALRLGMVCKHWRAMILNTSNMWSGIALGGRDHTRHDKYLHRSRAAPLRVMIQDHADLAAELFQDEPSRIQHLLMMDITTTNWCKRWDPRDLLSTVASDLLSCTLNLPSWPRGAHPEPFYSLFSGQGQTLRHLSIYNARIIPTDTLPSLTHLLIDNIAGVLALTNILDFMSRCPRIQDVCIRSPGETVPPQHAHHIDAIQLPCLRRMFLRIQHSPWLLAHIDAPPTALINVNPVTLPDLALIPFTPLSQCAPPEETTHLRIAEPVQSALTRGLVTSYHVELAAPSGRAGLFLHVTTPKSAPRAPPADLTAVGTALAGALTAPLFAHTTALSAARGAIALLAAPGVLRALVHLVRLTVALPDRTRAYELADALALSPAAQGAGPGEAGPVCPRLTTLVVSCWEEVEVCTTLLWVSRLVEARALAGVKVRRLCVQCPDAHHASVRPLQSSVDELELLGTRGAGLPRSWGGADVWPDWRFFDA